ncbi:MAG: hypothetical protein COZ05_16185 [Armatimonadetes bacterium CG_4_10_14_3_um_filter_59_10]|nr:MAG: hypothetical protein COZ05_16185 [Armatimonadetes bacterium CG_4_10_14_3_um_filter_59_10]
MPLIHVILFGCEHSTGLPSKGQELSFSKLSRLIRHVLPQNGQVVAVIQCVAHEATPSQSWFGYAGNSTRRGEEVKGTGDCFALCLATVPPRNDNGNAAAGVPYGGPVLDANRMGNADGWLV